VREEDARHLAHLLGAGRARLAGVAAHVGARAEAAARAGEHDGAAASIERERGEGLVQLGDQALAERVQPLGAIQRDLDDAVLDLFAQQDLAHASLLGFA